MKIFHIIRNSKNISLFKEIILHTLHSGRCDEVFISSGFFVENNKIQMSTETDSTGVMDLKNVANPQNIALYIKGCFNRTNQAQMWNFANSLRQAGYNTQVLPYKSKHHAKVFIAQNKKIPICEIIGSSNFTTSAYGTGKAYNIEADFVICNDSLLEKTLIECISNNHLHDGIMVMDYFEGQNLGKSLIEQMIWIRDNLF